MKSIPEYFSIIGSQKRPIRFIVSRFLRLSRLYTFLKIRRLGYVLMLHPSSLSLSLWVDENDRSGDSKTLQALIKPGDLYVDVGANIGHLAIEAALLTGPQGLVVAIEAHPTTARYLRENIEMNHLSNVYSAQCAVGEKFGWIGFSQKKSDDQNHVLNDHPEITVLMIPLDALLNDLSPTILKIDVEGYERNVLLGGRETLRRTKYIYFEAWDKHFEKFGYDFSVIYDLLSELGFAIAKITGLGIVEHVGRDFIPSNCINLLAYRSETDLLKRTNWTIG